jgi:AbiV family abortive infection protein
MATLIAKEGHYPMANSHLILAMEEAIKALFLYYKYQLNNVEIPVSALFKRHSHKHQFAKDNYKHFYNSLIKLMTKIVDSNKSTFTEEHFKEVAEQDPLESDKQRFIIDYFNAQYERIRRLNVEESMPKIQEWFNKADLNKSIGFYADYVNKKWRAPSIITEEDYELSKFLSWNLVLFTKMLLGTGATVS